MNFDQSATRKVTTVLLHTHRVSTMTLLIMLLSAKTGDKIRDGFGGRPCANFGRLLQLKLKLVICLRQSASHSKTLRLLQSLILILQTAFRGYSPEIDPIYTHFLWCQESSDRKMVSPED